jgi:tRNA nucleotidyltransferase (CCA-adding enzyme)
MARCAPARARAEARRRLRAGAPDVKTYVVGGWVRDTLLREQGRAIAHPSDRDWVVVGATPEEMLAQGFRPVGRDFPVFLHPETHEEYALARTERKVGPGYRGFVVHAATDVTLEQDLGRRDLTINAIARDDSGGLHDPLGGRADLAARVLRHAGPAFPEDPVRILRLARFAARFPDFTVAPETSALLRAMVEAGEADALVPERVWQEVSRGLMEARPSRMLVVLEDCGFVARCFPALVQAQAAHAALDRAAEAGLALAQRVAVLTAAACDPARVGQWLAGIRADSDSAQLATLLVTLGDQLGQAAAPAGPAGGAADVLADGLEHADALRRPGRFRELLGAWRVLQAANPGRDVAAGAALWERALEAARSVDAGRIAAAAGPATAAIAAAVAAARREAIDAAIAPMRAQAPDPRLRAGASGPRGQSR